MAELLLGIVGRRGGKSKAAAVFMTWLATCIDWTDDLSLGETGVALLIAPTERQAQIARDYIAALIDKSPLLSSLIEDRTQNVLTLKRQFGSSASRCGGLAAGEEAAGFLPPRQKSEPIPRRSKRIFGRGDERCHSLHDHGLHEKIISRRDHLCNSRLGTVGREGSEWPFAVTKNGCSFTAMTALGSGICADAERSRTPWSMRIPQFRC